MKCFYHLEREAVGTCRACSKGLCPACAADLGLALACKGRHETEAERIIASVANARRAGLLLPIFAIPMGLINLVWGFLSQPSSLFLILCGIGLIAVGVFFVIRLKSRSGS